MLSSKEETCAPAGNSATMKPFMPGFTFDPRDKDSKPLTGISPEEFLLGTQSPTTSGSMASSTLLSLMSPRLGSLLENLSPVNELMGQDVELEKGMKTLTQNIDLRAQELQGKLPEPWSEEAMEWYSSVLSERNSLHMMIDWEINESENTDACNGSSTDEHGRSIQVINDSERRCRRIGRSFIFNIPLHVAHSMTPCLKRKYNLTDALGLAIRLLPESDACRIASSQYGFPVREVEIQITNQGVLWPQDSHGNGFVLDVTIEAFDGML
eukprot:g3802.t1